ncbi:MAG: hypothetical protein H6754_06120 [Candidatus Omnitrophica bacterium]|nr:hypothetical protein [Candidatus Omnitrophota bacterium]
MKKIIVLVLAGMLYTTVGYTEMSKKSAGVLPAGKKMAALIERSEGKIDLVKEVKDVKGVKGTISLISSDGSKKEFEVIAKANVYSAKSAPLKFADLKKGDQVIVLYVVTLKGTNQAITVTQFK